VGDVTFNLMATALPVPEPSTMLLLGVGMVFCGMRKRKTTAGV